MGKNLETDIYRNDARRDIDTIKRLQKEIAEASPVRIAANLVRMPSYSDMPEPEREAASYIAEIFDKEGIPVEMREAYPGRVNVIAKLEGSKFRKKTATESHHNDADTKKRITEEDTRDTHRRARSLTLCGHTDTVPAYDMANPLSGHVVDGVLHGRGSVDMKGPLASMAVALIVMKRTGLMPPGNVYFAAVCDEEETGLGASDIVRRGPHTDGVIVGEPTSLIPCIGQKGLEWIRVRVIGKKTHGGNAAHGINAVVMAARFIDKIYLDYVPVLNAREYPPLGAPVINVGRIEGGDQPSTIPGECEILLDRRCVPSETIEQVYDELRALVDSLKAEEPTFNAEISSMEQMIDGGSNIRSRREYSNDEPLSHLPFVTDAANPLAVAAKNALSTLGIGTDHPAFPQTDGLSVFPAWTDAGFIANYTDSSCIILGPGDLGAAHSREEHISVVDMERAALVYTLIALDYCNDRC